MGFLRKLIRNFIPHRNYRSFETEKIRTSQFTAIRHKKTTSSLCKALSSISFFIAALCIFEAAVWFSGNFPEPANNTLRIFYLESRISTHLPHTVVNPFEVTARIVASFSLSVALLRHSQFLLDQHRHLNHKQAQRSKEGEGRSNSPCHPSQSRTDYIVLAFLAVLASPKKSDRWLL